MAQNNIGTKRGLPFSTPAKSVQSTEKYMENKKSLFIILCFISIRQLLKDMNQNLRKLFKRAYEEVFTTICSIITKYLTMFRGFKKQRKPFLYVSASNFKTKL